MHKLKDCWKPKEKSMTVGKLYKVTAVGQERSDSGLDEDGNRQKWTCQCPGEMAES